MKDSFSLAFYRAVLYSDFNLLKFIEKGAFVPLSPYICLKLNQKFTYLNLFETVKSLKQLFRLVQFVKQKLKHQIVLKVEDLFSYSLIKDFCSFYLQGSKRFVVESTTLLGKIKVSRVVTKFFIFIGNFLFSLVKHLFRQGITLIFKLNLCVVKKDYGVYALYNDVTDFQKILFLMVLIKKIYK